MTTALWPISESLLKLSGTVRHHCRVQRSDRSGTYAPPTPPTPPTPSAASAATHHHSSTHLYWCLQCFDAVGWLAGRKGIRPVKQTEWWGAAYLLFIKPSWQLRRTYFFNHYNVLL